MKVMKQALRSGAAALVASSALTACGGPSVEGSYTPRGDAFFDSFTFLPDDKVEVVLIGINHMGTYKLEDETVTITSPDGTVSQLNIDDNGCLTHQIFGVYCKGSSSPAPAAASAAPASAASGGTERYAATMEEGRLGLELLGNGTARLTMTPAAGPGAVTFEVSYEQSGNEVVLRMPGPDEEPLRFTRTGRDLVATMDGETARFVRQ